VSNPTSNFGWQMPQPTDLVTDLPADFEVFGQAVDTSLADLKGGTSGQILAKNSNTDMDFVWITNDQGDITGITASSPLTGGGTSGAVTVGIQDATTAQKGAVQLENSTSSTSITTAAVPASVKSAYDLANAAIPKSLIDAAGDLIVGTAADTAGRLGIGTAGQVLKVNSGATALEWGAASGGSTFSGCRVTNSIDQSISNTTRTIVTFDTESFDTDGFHSTSTNTGRMTIPAGKAGKYLVTSGTTFATNANGNREMYLFKNGNFYSQVFQPGTSVGSTSIALSDTLDLAVGDYVEIRVEQDSGSTVAVRGNGWGTGATFLTITYLGA
jgi:hypothetical protein